MRRIVPVVHATFAPPLAWQQVNQDPDRPCKRSDCLCPSKNGQGDPFLFMWQRQRGIARPNGEISRFYGYVADGIFQNQTEVNAHTDEYGTVIQPNAQPGDIRFK